jgi:hypothetical protein
MSTPYPHPGSSTRRLARRRSVALACLAASLAACDDAQQPAAPEAPVDVPRAFVPSPSLLAALADADGRIVPSLDAANSRPANPP